VKEDTQSRDGDTRWNQSDRNYSVYRDNAETTTPEESDDDDLSAMVDLPLAKPNRGDIMDDNKVTDDTTEMEMGLHTDMNKIELLTNDSNLYDRKHVTNKVTRYKGGLDDKDTKQEVWSEVGDMTLTDTIASVEARETGKVAITKGSKISSTVVNQVQEKADQNSCSYCGNKGHGRRANFETRKGKCPAHGHACTKCQRQDHFAAVCESVKEDLPADNGMMTKYEDKEEHDVQNNIKTTCGMNVDNTYSKFDITTTGTNKPPGQATSNVEGPHAIEEEDHFMKKEPPDNGVLNKYKHSHELGVP
jgi:hypothetical protein